jgi:hypothetical protein
MSYLNFDLIGHSQSGLTKRWMIKNSSDIALGQVCWHGPWRKYVFEAVQGGDRFDHHCLREIADFCETVTKDHRAS